MSKDIKKALEHCIDNECVGCPNNEELGSGETVCRGRLLPEVIEYVADLEAKLAEKDAERELDNSFWKQECDSLQKTLVEKDKEIEKLNTCVDFYKSYSVSFQEKIIDELERVKEFCNNPKNRVEYEYCPNAWTYAVDKDKLMLEIDNQIKQLKEMK